MLYLRGQDELLADIEARLRDTGNARWSDDDIVGAVNRALQQWAGRVAPSAMYDGPFSYPSLAPVEMVVEQGGTLEIEPGAALTLEATIPQWFWPADTYEVQLPAWMGDDVRPQLQFASAPGSLLPQAWRDATSLEVEPSADGGRTLRLHRLPSTNTVMSCLRLLYYVTNEALPLPSLTRTLAQGIDTNATTLTIGAVLDVAPAGWVRVDKEWIHYRGVARAATATTLQSLVRAQYATEGASHNAGAVVYWGAGAPNWALFDQLRDQACAFCHELFLNSAAAKERDLHERMVSYYQGRADMFWRRYAPVRAPRLKLPQYAG